MQIAILVRLDSILICLTMTGGKSDCLDGS